MDITRTGTAGQTVTDELRRWIVDQVEAGCRPQDIVAAMRASGWDEDVAAAAMAVSLREPVPPPAQAEPLPGGVPVPGAALAVGVSPLPPGDREVRVLMALRQPRVVLLAGLLADAECDALVALARPRLARSETVDGESGGSAVNPARTSDGMFFERGETALVDRIERRIAALLQWPLAHGEGLQVLRYRPGAEYKPHHDYFDPRQPGAGALLQRGGQRVGTLVMYLSTPEAGGATTFPDALLEVAPVKGHAVFFSYDRPHAVTRTLHGGAPVTAGEKWVATKWLRERPFT
jgi:prolyl 4-hydroxylase